MIYKKVKTSQYIFILLSFFFFCIAVYNPEIYGFNLSNYILLITSLITASMGLRTLRVKKIMFFLIILLYFILCVSALHSGSDNGFYIFTKLIVPICCMLVVSYIMRDEIGLSRVSNMLAYINLTAIIVGIFRFYILNDQGYTMMFMNSRIGRMRGSFMQPNVFATFLVITFPFAFCYFWNRIMKSYVGIKRIFYKAFLVITVLLNLYCIYMAKSRWSMVSIAAILLCYPYIFMKKRTKKRMIIAILGMLTIVFSMIAVLYFNDRINSFFGYRMSNEARKDSILLALETANKNLIFGMGLGHGIGKTLDSTIMTLLVDAGVIGVAVFLLMSLYCVIVLFRKCKEQDQSPLIPYLLMFTAFCVEMALETVFYNTLINCFLGIIWCLCLQSEGQTDKCCDTCSVAVNQQHDL